MKKLLRNPKGSRDWLPDEVIKQEYVKNLLVKVFELWGYRPIQTPILINWDTLVQGGKKLSDIAFKLIGQQGDLLALRADLTIPIARVTAERLKDSSLPLRFYYVGKVFRYHARKTTNECELYQIGIELIGTKEGYSDLEILKVLTDGFNKLGIKDYLVLVNHSSLWLELFRFFGDTAQELYKSLYEKDLVSFKKIIVESRLSKKEKEFWQELIQTRGNKEVIKQLKNLNRKVKGLKLKKVISYFEKLLTVFNKNVEIDLSLTSDVDYYTGMYFEAITPYLGRNIGSGGRYDSLISKFGFDLGAVGFSLCLEDLLLTLEKQRKAFPKPKIPRLIPANKNIQRAFANINKLQKQNKIATLSL